MNVIPYQVSRGSVIPYQVYAEDYPFDSKLGVVYALENRPEDAIAIATERWGGHPVVEPIKT